MDKPTSLAERVEGQAVSVLGAGRSGVAAANLLVELGARVCLSDSKTEAELQPYLDDLNPEVRLVTGRNDLSHADLVVVSPGIPPAASIWKDIFALGAPVWSEIELGFRAASAPMVAVTGTDGKTTTASLIGEVFRAEGRAHRVLGNIGRPLCSEVAEVPREGVLVVEVSCFQLLYVQSFRPRVAVLLNLAQDHLDYHPSFEHYVAAKLRVFERQGPGDTAVVSLDDPGIRSHLGQLPPGLRCWGFSARGPAGPGVGLEQGVLVDRCASVPRALLRRDSSPLLGEHNTENLAAAAAATLAMGVCPGAIARAFSEFGGLAHRLERLGTLDGVTWVNDSKATSPHAALAGLCSLPGPVLLVAGGVDKGLDLEEWAKEILQRCCVVVLIGELAARLEGVLRASLPGGAPAPTMVRAVSLEEAVARCRVLARPQQTVLLSPGCSSFDMFQSYEHRGDVFRDFVSRL